MHQNIHSKGNSNKRGDLTLQKLNRDQTKQFNFRSNDRFKRIGLITIPTMLNGIRIRFGQPRSKLYSYKGKR